MQIHSYVSDRNKKRKKRRAYLLGALGILAVYFIFFAAQWFILHSPIFRVDNIVVQGNSAVASADVVTLVEASALQGHHLFPEVFGFDNMLLWPGKVSQSELALVPQLSNVSITKNYFSHTITLQVSERTPFGMWCFSGASGNSAGVGVETSSSPAAAGITASQACYWFDDTGTIFERAFDTQGSLIYIVEDSAQNPRGLNQKVLDAPFVDNFISIMKVLRQSGLGIKEIDMNNLALQQVNVITVNGPVIYFSLRFSANDDLPVIQSLMAQPTFDNLQYIDCTTQDRLYYK